MQKYLTRISFVAGILFLISFSFSGTPIQKPAKVDRQPAFAGSFYPSDKGDLSRLLPEFFNNAPSVLKK